MVLSLASWTTGGSTSAWRSAWFRDLRPLFLAHHNLFPSLISSGDFLVLLCRPVPMLWISNSWRVLSETLVNPLGQLVHVNLLLKYLETFSFCWLLILVGRQKGLQSTSLVLMEFKKYFRSMIKMFSRPSILLLYFNKMTHQVSRDSWEYWMRYDGFGGQFVPRHERGFEQHPRLLTVKVKTKCNHL